jgi:hypothetical protein
MGEQYVFDAGPDLLEAHILSSSNEEFVAGYLANRAPVLPLIDELRELGFRVNHVADLVEAGPTALPTLDVLMDWFPRADPRGLQVDIASVLKQPWAYEKSFGFLIESFRNIGFGDSNEGDGTQWLLGGALVDSARERDLPTLLEFAREPRYGDGRAQLLAGLGRFRVHAADLIPILDLALSSADLEKTAAIHSLGELRAIRSKVKIEQLLGSDNDQVRSEASKALKKIATAERRAG